MEWLQYSQNIKGNSFHKIKEKNHMKRTFKTIQGTSVFCVKQLVIIQVSSRLLKCQSLFH